MSERIATKCPACHSSTLVIGGGNWLVCSLIGCPDPTRINSVGDRADNHFSDVQALRDERDRLRDELDVYRQAVQYVFEAINKFDDIQRKKAALTPAGGENETV